MKLVTLYIKPDCNLCQQVSRVISDVARRRRFRLAIRNILDNSGEFEKYAEAIPLVLVDGQEIARYRLTGHDLEAALSRE